MIINWIGQVLGLRESSSPGGAMEPLLRSSGIDESTPLGSVVDSPDLLHKELERARRYERGLSVSVLTVEPSDAVEDGPLDPDGTARVFTKASGPPQVVALLAASGLRDMLRQSDVLCYQPTENRFVLALAESDAEEAEKALVRIRGIFRERLGLDVQAGISRFPDDALTLAGLMDSAASRGARARTGTRSGMTASPAGSGDRAAAGNGDGSHGSNGQRPARRVTPLEVNDDE